MPRKFPEKTRGTELKNILLCEKSQRGKATYSMIPQLKCPEQANL